jgi:gentisate 1,2-dioxygenase
VLQALVGALEVWPQCHLTCHATLQCLVALCKDNAMMKANMTVTALEPVLHILQTCGSSSSIAERGFTLLAVLQVCSPGAHAQPHEHRHSCPAS